MRTNGCLRIMARPSTVLADRGLDDLELGAGLRHRTNAVALDREVGGGAVGLLGDDLQRLVGGGEGVLALEGDVERRAHQHAREVRPVITVPVSQAKLSSRPCGISPSVDCTVSAGPSSSRLSSARAALRLRCAGFNRRSCPSSACCPPESPGPCGPRNGMARTPARVNTGPWSVMRRQCGKTRPAPPRIRPSRAARERRQRHDSASRRAAAAGAPPSIAAPTPRVCGVPRKGRDRSRPRRFPSRLPASARPRAASDKPRAPVLYMGQGGSGPTEWLRRKMSDFVIFELLTPQRAAHITRPPLMRRRRKAPTKSTEASERTK